MRAELQWQRTQVRLPRPTLLVGMDVRDAGSFPATCLSTRGPFLESFLCRSLRQRKDSLSFLAYGCALSQPPFRRSATCISIHLWVPGYTRRRAAGAYVYSALCPTFFLICRYWRSIVCDSSAQAKTLAASSPRAGVVCIWMVGGWFDGS